MTIARNRDGSGKSIPFLYHDLMPNPSTRRIKIHTLLLRKFLNPRIFAEIFLTFVLHVVV